MSVTVSFTDNSTIPSSNIINAATKTPVSILYNSSNNSLIHYSSIDGQLLAKIDPNFTTSFSAICDTFSTIINSTLNASNALPFSLSNYDLGYYRVYPTLGSLAVGSFAHYLFGSAKNSYLFANSSQLISSFNGNDTNTYQIPNLFSSNILALPSSVCTNIANQIIAQDSGRSNSSSSWSALEFKTNDIIYFTLSLEISSIGSLSTIQQYIPAASNYPNLQYYVATQLI